MTIPAKTAAATLSADDLRQRIVAAINNPQFNGRRTTDGIAAEAGVPRPVVLDAIRTDMALARIVKVCPFRAEDGRPFITTKERFYKDATFREKLVDFLATERVQLG